MKQIYRKVLMSFKLFTKQIRKWEAIKKTK